tara:strand:+ start:2605 stop:3543 length:939 start_codon:yes stop_codon:yes gene_type:complete
MPKKKEAKAETSTETEEVAQEQEAVQTETPDESGDAGEPSVREKMYAEYAKSQEVEEPVEEKQPEETPGEPEAKQDKKEVKEDTKTEDKTVPLGALHEERQKRKELQAEVVELKNQVKDMLNKERQIDPEEAGDEEYIEDYDAELIKLKKQNEALTAEVDSIKAKDTQSEAEKAQTAFLTKVNKVHEELKTEGFDGFEECTPMIRQHIHGLIMQEPDPQEYIEGRKLLDVDTPEGWKKIYKEEIYPSIKAIINQKKTEELMDERIERKKKAALSGNSGGRPVQSKKDNINDLSPDEMNKRYMEMRQKRGAAV